MTSFCWRRAGIVGAVAFLVFANSLHGDFVYDDNPAIVENADVTGGRWESVWTNDFWGSPLSREGSHKSFRPLTTLTFRCNHAVGGMQAWGFHVVNVCIHVVCSVLVYRLISGRVDSQVCSLLASLLFAVHPIHCEAVASIVGRADALSALLVLTGLLCSPQIPLSVALSAAAMLCKETGVVLLPLLAVKLLLDKRKNPPVRYISGLALSFCVVCTARLACHGFEPPRFAVADNPLAHLPSRLSRGLSFLFLSAFHLSLFFSPTLCFDWSIDALPPVQSPLEPRFLAALAVYASLVYAVWRCRSVIHTVLMSGKEKKAAKEEEKEKEKCTVLFGLSLLVLPHLLASNLFAYVGFVAAERILYLPSVGFCLLTASVLQWAERRVGKRPICSVSVVVLLLLAGRTWERNGDWADELKLYQSATHISPSKAYANLGRVLAARGRQTEAAEAYQKALEARPNSADTWYNLGVLHGEAGSLVRASVCYRNAILFRPQMALAYLNLALLQWKQHKMDEAGKTLSQCSTLSGSSLKRETAFLNARTSCLFNWGRLLTSEGRHAEAVRVLVRGVEEMPVSFPSQAALLNLCGEALARVGEEERAEEMYNRALFIAPASVSPMLTMAHLRAKQNRSMECEEWLTRAERTAPNSTLVLLHRAHIEAHRGMTSLAADGYRRVLSVDGENIEALSSLATVLREGKREGEAEEVYRRLATVHPVASSFSNLGAILHLNGKLAEAEAAYAKALSLRPGDALTQENMKKLKRTRKL